MVLHRLPLRPAPLSSPSRGPEPVSSPNPRNGARRSVPRAVLESPSAPGAVQEGQGAPEKPSTLASGESREESGVWLWQTTKNLAGGLYGWLKIDRLGWGADGSKQKVELLGDTTHRAVKVGMESSARGKQKVKEAPPNIHGFLFKVGIMEIRYMRMLANLCSLTYNMARMSDRSLFRRHGLKLVTTSLVYEQMVRERPKTVSLALEEADGMAASPQLVQETYDSLVGGGGDDTQVPGMQAIVKLKETEPLDKMPTPAEVVGARLGLAASAAASAATAAASAATAAAVPLATNISSAAAGITAAPLQAITSQLQMAASIGQSSALATMATVTAAVETTWGHRPVTKKQAISSSYWFVADDERAHTRFFAIQGSNNIDHWRINLQFDPVTFEDPSLGLKVHRGFYEAAKVLYDQFLPLVEHHLASSPFAKVVFTGHSLGGSLSTLLMMMFLHRKVIPPLALGPVYTFGAPSIFCETTPVKPPAQYSEDGVAIPDEDEDNTEGTKGLGREEGVLERMGLNAGAIRNVMMHRDLVPRAFACDYALVSDLLARVSDSFRNLESLRHPKRQQMYYHLGRTLVLQPDEAQSFVHGGADHPLLPPGANLWSMREPWSLADAGQRLQGRLNNVQNAAGLARKSLGLSARLNSSAAATPPATSSPQEPAGSDGAPAREARRTGEDNLGEDGSNIDDAGPDRAGGARMGPALGSLSEALAALMDTPHPLDILGEPGSYGFKGAISRYHDPEHYCKALGGVLRHRSRPWRGKDPGAPAPKEGSPVWRDLPRLHHIEPPLRRSRKVRNSPGVAAKLLE